jgi:DNA-binding NarL/FixJ family response regulator
MRRHSALVSHSHRTYAVSRLLLIDSMQQHFQTSIEKILRLEGFRMEAGGSGRRQAVTRRRGFANSRAGEEATTVLLVDAHAWTREAVARGLEMALQDLRVLRFANVSELARAGPHTGAAVVLLNMAGIRLGDRRVSSAIAAIRSSLPGLPIVVLSEDEDSEAILEAIERGLKGYVPMSLELRVVAQVLQFVAAGGTYLPAELLLTSFKIPGTHDLTAHDVTCAPTSAVTVSGLIPREFRVLQRWATVSRTSRSRARSTRTRQWRRVMWTTS